MPAVINQQDVLNALHNLMGHRVNPGGTDDDYKRYIQDSFDYCWRYYKWRWTTKTVTTAADGILPTDFDPLGFYSVSDQYDVTWDTDAQRYVLNPAGEVSLTYQTVPPTLGTNANTSAPFPSAMVVAIGATVMAKQGENPTRADIQQEWDLWHSRLDRLVGQAESNIRRRPTNYLDRAGTYTGDVGA